LPFGLFEVALILGLGGSQARGGFLDRLRLFLIDFGLAFFCLGCSLRGLRVAFGLLASDFFLLLLQLFGLVALNFGLFRPLHSFGLLPAPINFRLLGLLC